MESGIATEDGTSGLASLNEKYADAEVEEVKEEKEEPVSEATPVDAPTQTEAQREEDDFSIRGIR